MKLRLSLVLLTLLLIGPGLLQGCLDTRITDPSSFPEPGGEGDETECSSDGQCKEVSGECMVGVCDSGECKEEPALAGTTCGTLPHQKCTAAGKCPGKS